MIRRFLLLPLALLALATGLPAQTTMSGLSAGVTIKGTQSSTLSLGSASYAPSLPNGTVNYTYGNGAGQVSLIWADTTTLTASTADTIRLRGSVLTDAFSNPINFGKIRALVVQCKSTNTNDIIIGNAADSTWVGPFGSASHTNACKPGGWWGFAMPNTGYTVADLTKKLKIANGAGSSAYYTIMILGNP